VKQIPQVKAVMTPFPHYVDSDQPIARALEMMQEHGIRHLPVVEGEKLTSVVTDRDLRRATESAASTEARLLVRDVRCQEAYIVELSEPLDIVVLHMARHRIDSALVVRNERLVGIFTMTDACRFLGELLGSLFPRGQGDDVA
jgi:acetoin utilization protein AcuB